MYGHEAATLRHLSAVAVALGVSWTDRLVLQNKNICKKAEVVPIALEIAKTRLRYHITFSKTGRKYCK